MKTDIEKMVFAGFKKNGTMIVDPRQTNPRHDKAKT